MTDVANQFIDTINAAAEGAVEAVSKFLETLHGGEGAGVAGIVLKTQKLIEVLKKWTDSANEDAQKEMVKKSKEILEAYEDRIKRDRESFLRDVEAADREKDELVLTQLTSYGTLLDKYVEDAANEIDKVGKEIWDDMIREMTGDNVL